ncbi:MAG: nickel-dependent lactate racemase, partial [Candidatus Bathyarchaeia archaeon]
MVDVWLPYGKTEVCARIPTKNFLGFIEPKEKTAVKDARAEIERALREPIGSKRLIDTAKPEQKVAIIVEDETGCTLSHIMIPPLLDELKAASVKDENITIIFGCGMHKAVTDKEVAKLLGEEVFRRVKVISHDCKAQDLVYAGITQKYGNKVYLNRVFAEADIKILTGDICFHSYAGYGGGRKGVLPGVSGEETIKHNHAMLLHPNAKTGFLEGNPVHEDMVDAARLAKVDFILNVVVNSKGEIIKSFAGDLEKAFSEGVKFIDEMYRIPVDRKAEIVVVSSGGHPVDANLFRALESVNRAMEVVKRGG